MDDGTNDTYRAWWWWGLKTTPPPSLADTPNCRHVSSCQFGSQLYESGRSGDRQAPSTNILRSAHPHSPAAAAAAAVAVAACSVHTHTKWLRVFERWMGVLCLEVFSVSAK